MIFETNRLSVRRLRVDDYAAFCEMQGDETVMRYITGSARDGHENKQQLNSCIEKYNLVQNDFHVWAAETKQDRFFVGTCALIKNEVDEHEIGYRLLKRCWRQGFGKELATGLIEYCFLERGLHRIVAHADIRNTASIRILESTMMFLREGVHERGDCRVRYYERISPRGRPAACAP